MIEKNVQKHNNKEKYLGLLFFINWFTDFFTENLGTEGKIKIKKNT